MDIINQLKEELHVEKWQVEAVVKLIDEGNTIPFIARYRKEKHGSMNDEELRNLNERLSYLRNLEDKKSQVLASIEEQGKLTQELRQQILDAPTQVMVDDLYRPYRPKRRTRATVAKEKGLEPLAQYLLEQNAAESVEKEAAKYVSGEKEVTDEKEALQGAMDIIAESISDEADYRFFIRELTMQEGKIVSTAKDKKAASVYENYYDYQESLETIAGHRVLALNRGENEKFLVVEIAAPVEGILRYLEKKVIIAENEYTTPLLKAAIADSYQRLIAPSIERDIRNSLTERAEDGAIHVFGKNLEQLLMQPPIANKVVLGWDPAFRTGCKLAVVDATGKVMATTVVYPTEPQNKIAETKATIKKLVDRYQIDLISVGNGTASRESEKIIVDILKEIDRPIQYVIVNEAGASVYSASKLATEEFPNFDVGQRSATSIARRLQDPLAELVKIEPQSIGVGQYQHDMNQKKLGEALKGVVEASVNKVGVDLNTASAALLEYVSGITKTIAKNIVSYREENGRFTDRRQLLKVGKLGPKAYEQCAGFLRILDGDNPLDATSVHPESYEATQKLLKELKLTIEDVRKAQLEASKRKLTQKQENRRKETRKKGYQLKNTSSAFGMALAEAFKQEGAAAASVEVRDEEEGTTSGIRKRIRDMKKTAQELGIGEETLSDILKELEKPGRDPRDDMPKPILRTDVLDIKDLKPGMILKGTVRNVIDFGAFVDIGVHQDGLVHISELSEKRYVKHPLDVVSVGDIVEVKVMSVDIPRKRIQLTMKLG